MTRLLAILATLLLLAAHALADETADEADVLRVQLAETRAEELAAKIELARRDLAQLQAAARDARAALQQKYKLGDGDAIDPQTRAIKRAPKKDGKK